MGTSVRLPHRRRQTRLPIIATPTTYEVPAFHRVVAKDEDRVIARLAAVDAAGNLVANFWQIKHRSSEQIGKTRKERIHRERW